MLISCGEIRVSMLHSGVWQIIFHLYSQTEFSLPRFLLTWGGFFFFQAQHLLFKAIAAVFASGSASRIAA